MNKAISNGNRQTETRNAGTMPYVYNPTGSNGLFQTGSTSRYKTANGNTQSIGSTTFTYDGFNRLATAQTAVETTTYTYNALGERIRKANQNGLATVFHYGPDGKLLYERDQAGNTKEYVWLGQRPLARIDNQTSIYTYHVDHLGTPQMMSDDTGSLVWKATYEPFGKASISPASTVENNLRFPGQYFDRETGMHYNYYRSAYNPGTGRYEEADPIGLEGGLNLYLYANAAPTLFIDPTGEFGVIGGVIGAGIELGMQAYKNHQNGCDLFDSDNYDFWDVGVSAAVGALGPGWLSVGKTTLRSGGAIRNLSGQLDRAQTANRAAKIRSRISKHDNEILDALATQGAFQTGKMLLNNGDACTCRQ